tara:strand:+ start:3531 stop:3797 length:267 start_codon:yes stop_codon:yes gene_type:complete
MTLFSWLVIGYFYGWGYCFLTDWHYQILWARGYQDLPHSFITFAVERFFGISLNDSLVMQVTAITFALIGLVVLCRWIKNKFYPKAPY